MTAILRLLAVAAVLLAPPVLAVDAAARLDAFTKGLQGLDGRFVQRVFDANGQLSEESSGRVALKAPRQFRWEYERPFPQLIVADGDHVWIFDPDLEQVTVRNQSHEEQGSPLAALIDPGELHRQFDTADGGEQDGLAWLVLTPKNTEGAQFASARLGFDGDGLKRMSLQDSLGQRTEVVFEQWRRNPNFAAGHFRFVPPAGVDVIGEVGEGAQAFPIED
ncbi:outer membrane lipoprotein chaperone LolA [Rehaibacterium terrae]|uniref:outer membrane lipoprotein chaperone LolA n=1 Tax=Rehaibacterium terrae TaxID=1341696 RepID=UPI00391AC284